MSRHQEATYTTVDGQAAARWLRRLADNIAQADQGSLMGKVGQPLREVHAADGTPLLPFRQMMVEVIENDTPLYPIRLTEDTPIEIVASGSPTADYREFTITIRAGRNPW